MLLLLIPFFCSAQKNKKYRWEVGLNVGASNFLGDLGGANQIGTHFVRDLEPVMTRPAVMATVRYKKDRWLGYRANLGYGKVMGDDKLTQERFRNNRNLNFRSNIFEFSAQVEFYISKERPGHVYHYKKLKGWRHLDIQEYAFVGVGGFYFNPYGKYIDGRWYALRQFRTEGEGIKPGTKMYSRYSVCFPMGMGFKYALNRQWSIGLEFGLRMTLTDYIDDVSTVYFDKTQIAAAQNEPFKQAQAAYFADPSLGLIPTVDGISVTGMNQERGHSDHKDSYIFLQVTVNYKIGKIRKTHSKF
ncbi:MAG TPA: DUF6089 family protein [Bacteroidia bacterium]|nr:DUF6089 family protein [Bacteroidia bacterium]